MNLLNLINRSEDLRGKYDYYLSLGFSDTASKVLSVLTFGDEELAFLVSEIGGSDVLGSLETWLQARDEDSVRKAIRAYYEEKHPQPLYDSHDTMQLSHFSFGGSSQPMASAFCELDDGDAELPFGNVKRFAGISTRASVAPPPIYACIREALSSDAYEPIEEKSAKSVFTAPTSTFRMTTSNASMGVVFNQVRSGRQVNMDQVRIEEVLNYFEYEAEVPIDSKFKISTEILEKKGNKKLL